MEKILAPADKILSEIGRLALARPLLSSILLIAAVTMTVCTNEFWQSAPKVVAVGNETNVTSLPLAVPTTPIAATPAAVTTLAASAVAPALPATATTSPAVTTPQASTPVATNPPTPTAVAAAPQAQTANWQGVKIQAGDTISGLFKKHGLSAKEAAALSHLSGAKILHNLKLGQEIRFSKDEEGRLQQLAYAISNKSTLNVVRAGDSFKATTQAIGIAAVAQVNSPIVAPKSPQLAANKPVETTAKATTTTPTVSADAANKAATTSGVASISGRITHSLSADARKAGLPAKQVNQLVQIFSQKNIAQNVRPGDEFSVLYEKGKTSAPTTKKSGKSTVISSGNNILAAQLITGDKTYRLIRFVDPKGRVEYYTPEGQSLRDGLVREPLNFTHISSYFSSNRLDPVLNYRRPHEGVDFAAPIGTPVQAAGDGTVIEAGYRGGYGRMVAIQHDSKYTTRYAHLSKLANNVQSGSAVKKGQIIGYVGQTGFATGPHLHFEIRVNDVAENPLTVALPGVSIPAAYRGQFLAKSKVLLAQLNTNRQVWLAQAKPTTRQKNRG